MKKVIQPLLIAACLLCLSQAAPAADQKIGTVDLGKVFDKYYKTIQSTAALKLEAADIEKERAQMVDTAKKHEEDWRALIDKANDQAVSEDSREQSKKAAAEKYTEMEGDKQSITEYERVASTRMREKQHQRVEEILNEIRGVLNAEAKAAGYNMVLDYSGISGNSAPIVIYTDGQNDMTEGLIKELNAAAPPGSLDTNAVSGAAASATNAPASGK
jgi:Skp family chaperone for outer membrane proteins